MTPFTLHTCALVLVIQICANMYASSAVLKMPWMSAVLEEQKRRRHPSVGGNFGYVTDK